MTEPNDPKPDEQTSEQSEPGRMRETQPVPPESLAGSIPPPPPPPPPPQQPQFGAAPPYGPPAGYYPPPWGWAPAPQPPRKKRSRVGLGLMLILGAVLLGLFTISVVNKLGGEQGSGLGFTRQIGLVRIQGVLMQDEAKDFWMDSLKRLGEDKSIRGVVVRIETPGGAVGASQEIAAALEKLATVHKKRVYVSMGDTAASGGYYIASAAERVYALKGTLTGSIGVIMSLPKLHELAGKVGYSTEVIKSGRFKDAWSSMRPTTDIERQMMQGLIQNAYDQFVTDILKHRDAPLLAAANALPAEVWTSYLFEKPEEVTAESYLRQVADGRVYSGEQAKQLGLVDEIGTLDDTLMAMGREFGIEGTPEVLEYKPRQGLLDMLNSKVDMIIPRTHASLQYLMMLE